MSVLFAAGLFIVAVEDCEGSGQGCMVLVFLKLCTGQCPQVVWNEHEIKSQTACLSTHMSPMRIWLRATQTKYGVKST